VGASSLSIAEHRDAQMDIEVSASRITKASKDTVWEVAEDLESYPRWGDSTRKTRMVSQRIVSREGNVVVCDVEEVVSGIRSKHRDRFTLYPKDRIEEEIIEGRLGGRFVLTLTETPQGTCIDWNFHVTSKSLTGRVLGLFGGKKLVQGGADEYCRQLAEYAEAHPNPGPKSSNQTSIPD